MHGVPAPFAKRQSGLSGKVGINLLLDGTDTPILLPNRISEEVQAAIDAGATVNEYEGSSHV